MLAIIIQDKDALALLDGLKLESFDKDHVGYGVETNDAWHSLPEGTRKELVERIHRRFHFVVTRWLQDQGTRCVR